MAQEILRTTEDFYIVARAAGDQLTRVLKHDDMFAVFSTLGDVGTLGIGSEGIYRDDTRFLSRMLLRFADRRPVLLSSTVRKDNAVLTVDLTNSDVPVGDVIVAPRGMLHLFRAKLLWDGACHERIRIHNYGHLPVSLPLDLIVECDFADIFEVRGMERPRRGTMRTPVIRRDALEYRYEGLDGIPRWTRFRFDPAPEQIEEGHVRFGVRVAPGTAAVYEWTIRCDVGDEERPRAVRVGFDQAAERITRRMHAAGVGEPEIMTGNDLFDAWLARSVSDLRMLRTDTDFGPYAYAGVPWFSTVFGRDGIITALESLWFDPNPARGVLSYLAATQAQADSPSDDAQPGKILHEIRNGEMALLHEVPFHRYYGSIDATPLFIMLAGAYHERTGDLAFIRTIWPNVRAALDWIDRYGDADGDGFIEYVHQTESGLLHQGWKDSTDPIFHADGTLAEPPIALCEVQGYVYAARRAASALASELGEPELAAELDAQAEALRERFEEVFWDPALGTYGIALDADKRLCRVRTSNAGHCLWTGIASEERAAILADQFIGDDFFTGWGVRTVATTEARYNPMSYHNGSVWPHDNALIAAGLARYGFKYHASQILEGLFEATQAFDLHRLPELFCGFHRRPGEDPTRYPTACSPQAWASGAVLLLLRACLGLEVRGARGSVRFNRPFLPESLPRLQVRGLRAGTAVVDVELRRRDGVLSVEVLRHEGELDVALVE